MRSLFSFIGGLFSSFWNSKFFGLVSKVVVTCWFVYWSILILIVVVDRVAGVMGDSDSSEEEIVIEEVIEKEVEVPVVTVDPYGEYSFGSKDESSKPEPKSYNGYTFEDRVD